MPLFVAVLMQCAFSDPVRASIVMLLVNHVWNGFAGDFLVLFHVSVIDCFGYTGGESQSASMPEEEVC